VDEGGFSLKVLGAELAGPLAWLLLFGTAFALFRADLVLELLGGKKASRRGRWVFDRSLGGKKVHMLCWLPACAGCCWLVLASGCCPCSDSCSSAPALPGRYGAGVVRPTDSAWEDERPPIACLPSLMGRADTGEELPWTTP
jgi:hypothetical protein